MIYLNVILTLIFISIAYTAFIFSLLLHLMRKEGMVGREEIDEQRAYTKGINSRMIRLHDEMLAELKKQSKVGYL